LKRGHGERSHENEDEGSEEFSDQAFS